MEARHICSMPIHGGDMKNKSNYITFLFFDKKKTNSLTSYWLHGTGLYIRFQSLHSNVLQNKARLSARLITTLPIRFYHFLSTNL